MFSDTPPPRPVTAVGRGEGVAAEALYAVCSLASLRVAALARWLWRRPCPTHGAPAGGNWCGIGAPPLPSKLQVCRWAPPRPHTATPCLGPRGLPRTHLAPSGRRAAGGARGRSCTPRPAPAAEAAPATAAAAPSSARSGGSTACHGSALTQPLGTVGPSSPSRASPELVAPLAPGFMRWT